MFYLLFLLACSRSSSNILIDKKINSEFCISDKKSINYGFWILKDTNEIYLENRSDSVYRWLRVFKTPTHMVNNNNFILGKNKKEYVIIKLKKNKIENIFFVKDSLNFLQKRVKLNIPDSLVLRKL